MDNCRHRNALAISGCVGSSEGLLPPGDKPLPESECWSAIKRDPEGDVSKYVRDQCDIKIGTALCLLVHIHEQGWATISYCISLSVICGVHGMRRRFVMPKFGLDSKIMKGKLKELNIGFRRNDASPRSHIDCLPWLYYETCSDLLARAADIIAEPGTGFTC